MSDEFDDVFSDEPESTEEVTAKAEETKVEKVSESDKSDESKGEKQTTEVPPTKEEETEQNKSEKMIPESRLKAALKDMGDKLSAKDKELLELKAQSIQLPDPNEDPEGHRRMSRLLETRDLMRELVSDFDEKMAHFKEMTTVNPELNDFILSQKNPAKAAYDLATKSIRIKKYEDDVNSEEYKEFLQYRERKAKGETEVTTAANALASEVKSPVTKVPNLNRNVTPVNPSKKSKSESDEDEDLFRGHYSHQN